MIRRAPSTSCGAAAEFSQGRKPLVPDEMRFKAPEGRQSARVNVNHSAAQLPGSRRSWRSVAPAGAGAEPRAMRNKNGAQTRAAGIKLNRSIRSPSASPLGYNRGMDEEHRQPAPPDSTPAFFGWLSIVCGISVVIDQRIAGETVPPAESAIGKQKGPMSLAASGGSRRHAVPCCARQ